MLPFTRPTLTETDEQAVLDVMRSGWITTGPKVAAFEQALADYLGGDVTVRAFNSATSALEAVLLASGIGPGDEVIVPAMSFTATANVVVRVGARPVFVDVDLDSRITDADYVEQALTPRTRAVIPVHFAGLSVDMAPLRDLTEHHRLLLLEDAAQAIGTRHAGRHTGSGGNPACFSFHPNKNITTIEGGAVATDDAALIRRLERIRFHGIERNADGDMNVPLWGGKMNLPDMNAALGLSQLARLDEFNRKRRQLAERYLERLPAHEALHPPEGGPGHSWHMFCVRIDYAVLNTTRAAFQRALADRDIGTGVHYPAMHLFGLYRSHGYAPGDFPHAETIGEQTLTLPLFPGMEMEDVDKVCDALGEVLNG